MHLFIFFLLSAITFFLISCQEGKREETITSTESSYNGWKKYTSPELSFQYPSGWVLSVDTSNGEVFHISHPEQKESGIIGYDISISYFQAENDFNEFVKKQIQTMEQDLSIKMRTESEISFDSKNAFRYQIEFPTDAGRNEPGEVYFIKGEKKYYILFNAGMNKYKVQADSIIQTIQLK